MRDEFFSSKIVDWKHRLFAWDLKLKGVQPVAVSYTLGKLLILRILNWKANVFAWGMERLSELFFRAVQRL